LEAHREQLGMLLKHIATPAVVVLLPIIACHSCHVNHDAAVRSFLVSYVLMRLGYNLGYASPNRFVLPTSSSVRSLATHFTPHPPHIKVMPIPHHRKLTRFACLQHFVEDALALLDPAMQASIQQLSNLKQFVSEVRLASREGGDVGPLLS
jgi:hypothetical protein